MRRHLGSITAAPKPDPEPRPALTPCADCPDPGLCGTEGECSATFTPPCAAAWDRP